MGTANDFARSLGISLDPAQALTDLERMTLRWLDAVRVSVDEKTQWMINAATGGNAAEIVRRLDTEQKKRWGPWVYIRGVVAVATDPNLYPMRVAIDDHPAFDVQAFNVMVSNGRTAGTIEVAPSASLEDGRVEIAIIRAGPLLQTAELAADFFQGDYLRNDQVQSFRAMEIRIECDRDIGFSIDGEPHWGRRFHFEARRAALPAIVGPSYAVPRAKD